LRLANAGHKALGALAEPAPAGPARHNDYEVPELATGDAVPAEAVPRASLGAPPSQVGEVLYDGRGNSKGDNNNRTVIAIGVLLLGIAVWLTMRSRSGGRPTDEPSDEDLDAAESNEDGDEDDARSEANVE
jgi:hypothetical protein